MSVWYEPVGVDFSAALVRGLKARMVDEPPEAMARTTLLLPTRRMLRRVEETFLLSGASVLPRLALVSDLSPLVPHLTLPETLGPLALRLQLAGLVEALLDRRPDLAPRGAALDLAGSLADLLQEMKEEGVAPEALEALDPAGDPRHWQDSLAFLRIVTGAIGDAWPTPEDVQATCLDALDARWVGDGARDRVIVAGSTGSRAPTMRLMRAVAALPRGEVILPGLDDDMPEDAWNALDVTAQDHPQYRHRAVLRAMGTSRAELARWSDAPVAAPARNRLVSLALRPPPATHAWLTEGPALALEMLGACAGVTLVEAASPLEEAEAIALRLRQAVEEGTRAALISPDRVLSRQVATCLARWGIEPDDSAGRPLDLSPPGRLLLQVAQLRGMPLEAESLVALLKHPLAHSNAARNTHLRRLRDVEIGWLRGGPMHPTPEALRDWIATDGTRGVDDAWSAWLADTMVQLPRQGATAPLTQHVEAHVALAAEIAGGSAVDEADIHARPTGALWDGPAGEAARGVLETLAYEAGAAPQVEIDAAGYARLLGGLLAAEDVREPFRPHPGVMIWGALEARVQGAELVVLGGLNDETWPALPGPDMWMSRRMRAACGLRAPERSVGLSAHDFQQAVAGAQVWLTRATRSADAQTVPSRWLNRLQNLLGGVGADGEAALAGMRARGEAALARTRALLAPQARHEAPPAPRPAPKPPAGVRPERLSVTAVERLIRDPYAIYAAQVLGLRPLSPLRPPSDAALRGSVLHDALARLGKGEMDEVALLSALSDEMAHQVPGPARRRLWQARFARIAGGFLEEERARRRLGAPAAIEAKAAWPVPGTSVTLVGRADRIDLRGKTAAIFDYKTGTLPSPKQEAHFARQLRLEMLMVEGGAFESLGAPEVTEVAYLGVGRTLEVRATEITPDLREAERKGLVALLRHYADAAYPARLAHETMGYGSDYDHLSRFGEWDDTVPFQAQPVDR